MRSLWSPPFVVEYRPVKPTRIVEDVIRRVHEALPVEAIGEDLRRNVAEMAGAAISRMDLVTREEFDAQLALLEDAKARVEALEKRVREIEAAGSASPPGD